MESSGCYGPPLKLVKLPNVVMTPTADDQVIPAGYEGIDIDADEESVLWSMRKVLTMQRHCKLPDNIGGIGGFAVVTTVSAEGIRQRILDRWPADKLGTQLRPGPLDWDRWHLNNPKPGSASSKFKRDLRLVPA